MKVLVLIVTAVFVPGGLLILAALWWRRRAMAKEQRAIALRIVPPRQIFGETSRQETDALRAAAQRRRDHAADKRREANRIDTGQSVEERLRLVR